MDLKPTLLVSISLALFGCTTDAEPANPTDPGAEETSTEPADSGGLDTVEPDVPLVDAEEPDTQLPDTQLPDTNAPDTQLPDTNAPDIQEPDVTDPPPVVPRVLLIIADDMGIDATEIYADQDGDGVADDGRTYAPMPNLAKICSDGVQFQRAWSYPICSPTRSSILTGRYAFRTGIGTAVGKVGLKKGETTLPQLLDQVDPDFASANIGKWHLGTANGVGGDDAPKTMGWDHFAGLLSGGVQQYDQWNRTVNGVTDNETGYTTTVMVDDAVDWIGQQDPAKPWLLWLAFNAPHTPFHLPPAALHTDTSLTGTTPHINANKSAYYRAAIQAMDTEVGRLTQWIEDQELGPVTIIFVGDNGTPNQAVEAPWLPSRVKGTVYQGGVRVPFCVAGPAVSGDPRKSEALVSTVDLFATILELLGGDVPTLLNGIVHDSQSIVPLLQSADATGTRTYNLAETFGADVDTAVGIRGEQYKLVRVEGEPEAFYDISQDALETAPLSIPGLTGAALAAYEELSQTLITLGATNP
ncbi:MAG: arylsulfatase A-like enzyme [Myxococcota bacterium]|jgi:arylsulfatase A-like enzyme